MHEFVPTLCEDSEGSFLVTLQARQVQGGVAVVIHVAHVKLFHRETRGEQVWGRGGEGRGGEGRGEVGRGGVGREEITAVPMPNPD